MGSKEDRSGRRLVNAVLATYEGAQTVVRTTEGDSKTSNVKVGLHQGSVVSPVEIITRELRAGLPLKLLYAGDLMLMEVWQQTAGLDDILCDKIVKWKSGLEAKGLKMNMRTMQIMLSCSIKDRMEEKGKWHCGV